MQLPLVAVIGDATRVPEETLDALRPTWRFGRAEDVMELLKWEEAPEVVFLASTRSRARSVVSMLREALHTRAVLFGLGEDSDEIGLALHEVDGWVRVPASASSLGSRLEQLRAPAAEVPLLPLPAGPPERLGPYRLRRRLGAGNFGVVYEAEDTRDGSPCALKVAHAGVRLDSDSRARWQREASLLRQVRIPGIVGVRGSGDVDGYLCLVMDLLKGRALHEVVDGDGPLGEYTVVRMGERLGRALRALHALGVLHRDVKPANVVLDPRSGVANLTDLGLAVHLRSQELTASDVLLGTAGFLSPERIRGERANASTDAYALGATLYYALSGVPPYRDPSPMALLRRVSEGDPAPPMVTVCPTVSPELAVRIEGLIAPDADDRLPLGEFVDWCFEATGGG